VADVDIERDNTRGLARGNGRNGAGPARPPLLEDASVGRRVEMTVSGEWKFSFPRVPHGETGQPRAA
jgi:hypothetical protein